MSERLGSNRRRGPKEDGEDKGKKKGAPKKKTIVASKQSANDYGDDYDDFGDF